MQKQILALVAGAGLFVGAGADAFAVSSTIYPDYPGIEGSSPNGVFGDSAPGFGSGSFQANGTSKTSIYLTADTLFGAGSSVTIGDLVSFSYWTNKSGDQNSVDWYVEIYTKADGTNDDSWYGRRINAEPYFSNDRNAPSNQWNQWSTEVGSNQLRVFDANRGDGGPVYGTYNDPFLSNLTGGTVNWNDYYSGYQDAEVDYRGEVISHIGISTGSGWAAGFTGLVDGFSISWNDGGLQTSTVNFEAIPTPATAVAGAVMFGLLGVRRRRIAS